jgi:CBS domain-containing protein
MAVIKLKRRIKAHPDTVWKVISDMTGLALTAPHISKVEILEGHQVGLKRRLHDDFGRWWQEECVQWEDQRSYTMEVGESNFAFAFKKMKYTWGMVEKGKNITIWMRFRYTPRYGVIGQVLDRFKFRPRFEGQCNEVLDAWIRAIHSREWVYQVTVDTILEKKGHDVFSITPDTTIIETARLLREKRIGTAMVLDPDGSIAGLVSERDIVTGLAENGPDVIRDPVSRIMTKKVIVCQPDDNMVLIMSCMSDRRIRHLPVMDGDEITGIISIGDVVKTRMEELESESATLKEFIAARRWRELYRKLGPAAGEFM